MNQIVSGAEIETGKLTESLESAPAYKSWGSNPFVRLLLSGIVLTLPMLLFAVLLYYLVRLVASILNPISLLLYPGDSAAPWFMHLVSFCLLILFFLMAGMVARRRSGKTILRKFEQVYLEPLPLYRLIRDTVNQFTGVQKMPFSQVVLVDPYNTGIMLTGFVTERVRHDIYTVYVPTAPNPVNGNIYHVPDSKLIFLNVKPESAMRTIMGMGTGSTCLFTEEKINQLRAQNSLLTPDQISASKD